MARFQKHCLGHINPIFAEEENALLAAIDRASRSSSNSQILGKNGEAAVCSLLNRYLPVCFRAVAGHFVTPSGLMSPQLDVMVIDSRYPVLAQNQDGSVLTMLHSVVAAIEVKVNLVKKEILKIRKNASIVAKLQREAFPSQDQWGGVLQSVFAYRSGATLDTVVKHYFNDHSFCDPPGDICILRVHDRDQPSDEGPLGALIWLESGYHPSTATTLAPLSDFYYRLVQDGYYTLSSRKFDFRDLGEHTMLYMNWGTFPCENRGS